MPVTSRIACLMVPLFPLAARLRHEPGLKVEPLVIVDGSGTSARVMAATRAARQAGIHPGLSLPQARAILPQLIARSRDLEGERAAQQALLEVAQSLTPRVEDGGEGIAYGDVTGPERQHRPERQHHSVHPELELARYAEVSAARLGLPLRVGVGASKLVARVAAQLGSGPTIVPPAAESGFLEPLPLHHLPMSERVAETLARWGLRTLGDLAALPVDQVVSRLGKLGGELHAAARGCDPRPLFPRHPRETFREAVSCEWPQCSLAQLLEFLRPSIERLMQRLEVLALACRRIEIVCQLDADGEEARAIDLPAPTRDVRTLLQLIELDLTTRPPAAPVVGVALTAHADRPRCLQHLLFGPPALAPEKLATTIARLAARLGVDRVGRPVIADGHRPERCHLDRFDPPAPSAVRWPPKPVRMLTIRVLRPPVPVEVVLSEGRPSAVRPCHVPSSEAKAERRARGEHDLWIAGAVQGASGPWRCEEGWWAADAMARDYFDVELRGGLYRLYRDCVSEQWFVDGVYD